jgi:hypothetical protein
MDEDTHFELNDEQKTRLFSLGYAEENLDDDEDVEASRLDNLYRILKDPLPLPHDTVSAVPDVLRSMAGELVSIAGKPIRQLILGADTSLATLEQIKVYAKHKGRHVTVDTVKDTYMAVYFAAIAQALILHGVMISQHKQSDLARFFKIYEKESWMLPELKDLFKTAAHKID